MSLKLPLVEKLTYDFLKCYWIIPFYQFLLRKILSIGTTQALCYIAMKFSVHFILTRAVF